MSLVSRLAARRVLGAGLVAALVVAAVVTTPHTAQAATSEGLLCDSNAQQTFSLTAEDGYISTPDGNSIYMWSYGNSSRSFQLPGPTLCVTSGQPVTVILHNTLREETSIVFPGQTGADLTRSRCRRDERVDHLHVHRRQPRHLPVRERHRRRQAGPDGHVRSTRGAARR
jgi:hypothetical protein